MEKLIKKILKEETEGIDTNLLNFLKRRFTIEKIELGDESQPFYITSVSFKVGDDYYGFNSFMSKRQQVRVILDMLYENDMIDLDDYNQNIFDADKQKVIKTVRYFVNGLEL